MQAEAEKTLAQRPEPQKESWRFPPCWIGEIVLHYHGSDSHEPSPALVTKVGNRALSLTIFADSFHNGMPLSGVRHRDDPDRRVEDPAGFWVYSRAGEFLHCQGH